MIWIADQGSKALFWVLIAAFLAQLAWLPLKRFFPAATAAEPIHITEVQRGTKQAALRTSVIVKTP